MAKKSDGTNAPTEVRKPRRKSVAQKKAEERADKADGVVARIKGQLKRSKAKGKADATDAEKALAAQAKKLGGNRVLNHGAHAAGAIGGTLVGEYIETAEWAEDKFDEPLKARAIPAVGGMVIGLFGTKLGLPQSLADALCMGLMAPVEVSIGEKLYEKMTEE